MTFTVKVFLTLSLITLASGKTYERCELAKELKNVHKASTSQLATWVCIAYHESSYRTQVVGSKSYDHNGSHDHGIFQINDKYWCSPPNTGKGCGKPCAKFEDDDISDDFACVKKIYAETKKMSGDGFTAWDVYKSHCKGDKAKEFIKDCF